MNPSGRNSPPARHTAAWYDRLATLQTGYHYPWRSDVGIWNGEDEYLSLVRHHLHASADVLDAACGHGAVALEVAPLCRSVLGYDQTAAWVAMAQEAARVRGLSNVTFLCHDASAAANGGAVRLPAPDASFDLLICSKGPFHWIEDATRVARPGAVLLMLVPDATPVPAWNEWLPGALRLAPVPDPDWARPAIEQRLADVGLVLHSWWTFDVPECFPDEEALYAWLAWGYLAGEVPSLAEVHPILARLFAEFGSQKGVEVRHRRYLWKAVVPG